MDDNTIEGTYSVVNTEKVLPHVRYQATIKSHTDHKLVQVENQMVTVQKVDKFVVQNVMAKYLQSRVNRMEVKAIFFSLMMGVRPSIQKVSSNKWTCKFVTVEGDFIETYDITFIEL